MHEHTNTQTTTQTLNWSALYPLVFALLYWRLRGGGGEGGIEEWAKPSTMMGKTPSKKREREREREKENKRENKCEGDELVCICK